MRILPFQSLMLPRYLLKAHLSSNYSSRQLPYEETPTPEKESDDPVGIDNDPAIVNTWTVNSLVQHITDGKKIIYILSFCNNHEQKIFLDVCRYQC